MATVAQLIRVKTITDLETAVNAYLAPLLSNRILAVIFDVVRNEPTAGANLTVTISTDGSGSTVIANPYVLHTFTASSEADAVRLVTNYVAANPAAFVSQAFPIYQPTNDAPVRGVTLGVFTNTVAADGAANWGFTSASSGGAPTGPAGGDLAGTYPNPLLAAIGAATGPIGDGTHVPVVTIDTKGRVTALTSTAITYPSSLPPSGAAGGDLAGTYPNPTLNPIGVATGPIGDGTHVSTVTIDTKGRVTGLTSTAITYPGSLPPSGAAGGDLAGTYPNPTLAVIGAATGPIGDGATIPVVTIDAKGRVTGLTSVAVGAPTLPTGLTAWVDSVYGNDGTGTFQREDKPFLTIAAATLAVSTAGGGEVIVRTGTYAETLNIAHNLVTVRCEAGVTINLAAGILISDSGPITFSLFGKPTISTTGPAIGFTDPGSVLYLDAQSITSGGAINIACYSVITVSEFLASNCSYSATNGSLTVNGDLSGTLFVSASGCLFQVFGTVSGLITFQGTGVFGSVTAGLIITGGTTSVTVLRDCTLITATGTDATAFVRINVGGKVYGCSLGFGTGSLVDLRCGDISFDPGTGACVRALGNGSSVSVVALAITNFSTPAVQVLNTASLTVSCLSLTAGSGFSAVSLIAGGTLNLAVQGAITGSSGTIVVTGSTANITCGSLTTAGGSALAASTSAVNLTCQGACSSVSGITYASSTGVVAVGSLSASGGSGLVTSGSTAMQLMVAGDVTAAAGAGTGAIQVGSGTTLRGTIGGGLAATAAATANALLIAGTTSLTVGGGISNNSGTTAACISVSAAQLNLIANTVQSGVSGDAISVVSAGTLNVSISGTVTCGAVVTNSALSTTGGTISGTIGGMGGAQGISVSGSGNTTITLDIGLISCAGTNGITLGGTGLALIAVKVGLINATTSTSAAVVSGNSNASSLTTLNINRLKSVSGAGLSFTTTAGAHAINCPSITVSGAGVTVTGTSTLMTATLGTILCSGGSSKCFVVSGASGVLNVFGGLVLSCGDNVIDQSNGTLRIECLLRADSSGANGINMTGGTLVVDGNGSIDVLGDAFNISAGDVRGVFRRVSGQAGWRQSGGSTDITITEILTVSGGGQVMILTGTANTTMRGDAQIIGSRSVAGANAGMVSLQAGTILIQCGGIQNGGSSYALEIVAGVVATVLVRQDIICGSGVAIESIGATGAEITCRDITAGTGAAAAVEAISGRITCRRIVAAGTSVPGILASVATAGTLNVFVSEEINSSGDCIQVTQALPTVSVNVGRLTAGSQHAITYTPGSASTNLRITCPRIFVPTLNKFVLNLNANGAVFLYGASCWQINALTAFSTTSVGTLRGNSIVTNIGADPGLVLSASVAVDANIRA